MPTPQAVNIQLFWQINGVDWAVNSLWYIDVKPRPYVQADADEYAAGIEADWTSSLIGGEYNAEVQLDRMSLRDFNTEGNPIFFSQIDNVGTRGGDMLPRQTCAVTTTRTAFVTRRGRGRIYWPAPAAGTLGATGLFDGAFIAAANAWTNALRTIPRAGSDAAQLGVFSRVDNIVRSVISVNTDNSPDVQVRRRDLSV